MSAPRFVELDGRRYLWRDVLEARRAQRAAARATAQPVLFTLRDDRRPATQRTAAGRYHEPTLFETLARPP